MPKIPLDFTNGENSNPISAVANSPSLNLYPQVDKSTGKPYLACTHGSDTTYTLGSNNSIAEAITAPLSAVSQSDVTYSIVGVSGGDPELWSNGTLKSVLTGRPSAQLLGSWRMATNGINIVAVNPSGTTADDFVYDIAGGTVANLDVDPNYAGFGKAKDVVYHNGKYVFITVAAVFHGDLKTDAGQGVAFNALAFAELPLTSGQGAGVEVASGALYAFGTEQTVLYQDTGTTPFSYVLRVNDKITVGVEYASSKKVVGNTIYLLGASSSSIISAYAINGITASRIDNGEWRNHDNFGSVGKIYVTAYTDEETTFVQFLEVVGGSSFSQKNITYDTATKRIHFRGGYNSGKVSAAWPYKIYLKNRRSSLKAVGIDYNSTASDGIVKIFFIRGE